MLSLSRIGLIILIAILPQIVAPPAAAEWSPGGIAICSASGAQQNPLIVSDGTGGAIVVWADQRAGNWDIYAQRIDHDGNALWTTDGVPVCIEPGDEGSPAGIAADGLGGAFIAWRRNERVFLQRIDNLGTARGPASGVEIGQGYVTAIISDGMGGVILSRAYTYIKETWPGQFFPFRQIYLHRISATLGPQWGSSGIKVADEWEWADARLAADGTGGAFAACTSAFEGSWIFRLDAAGSPQWETRDIETDIQIIPDGAGGAIVGSATLQRVNATLDFLWGQNGVEAGTSGGLVTDGAGGAIVGSSIVQRVDSAGALVWGPAGVETGVSGSIVSDEAGGAILGSTNLQRVSPTGLLLYRPGGIATGATASAKLAPNGDHGAYLAWGGAGALDQDIFIQRIPHACEPVLSPIGDRNADAGSELAIDLSASSGALDDTLVYWTNADSVLQSLFSFNELTGEFRWTPVPGDAGEHRVTFGVWGTCGEDHESIAILVRLNGNLPPKLDPIAPVFVYEGYAVVIEAHATDPDGDELLYSIDDARFARNGNVFTWRTRAGDAGIYHPTIRVTDGILSDSMTVTVEVAGGDPSDPMSGPSSGNDWHGNLVTWHSSLDGYLSASTSSWNAAVVSGPTIAGSSKTFVVRIDHRVGSTNYMLGATATPPDATDYHYSRIDLGIYIHSSGSLRPTWAPSETSIWNRSIPTGVYDVRIALDPEQGRVAFAIDDVPAYDAPLSTFSDPVWSVVVTRSVPAACYIQINPYSEAARVYDVWRPGIAPPPDTGGTVLGSFDVSETGDWVRVRWLLDRCSPAAQFHVSRAVGDGAYEAIADPEIDRVDLLFTLIDRAVTPGNEYRYRIDVTDEDGRKVLFETDPVTVPLEPTVLDGFIAAASDTAIDVHWTLASCAPDAQFFVSRKQQGGEYAELMNVALARNGLDFSIADETVVPGATYGYRVDVEDHDGRRTLLETYLVTFTGAPPRSFKLALGQNYPNPFNPGTAISYTLPARGRVVIEIFDVQGRLIRRLVDAIADRGPHAAPWNGLDDHGRTVESGVYFYRLTAQGSVLTRKMIILR